MPALLVKEIGDGPKGVLCLLRTSIFSTASKALQLDQEKRKCLYYSWIKKSRSVQKATLPYEDFRIFQSKNKIIKASASSRCLDLLLKSVYFKGIDDASKRSINWLCKGMLARKQNNSIYCNDGVILILVTNCNYREAN